MRISVVKRMVAGIFLALLVLAMSIWYAIHFITVNKQTGSCLETNAPLTSDELRQRVIKSFLTVKMTLMTERNEYGGQYQMALVPKRMTEEDIIESIKSASILDFRKSSVTYLENMREIESLELGTLQDDFTLIKFSTLRREMEIIPGDSFEQVGTEPAKQFYIEMEKNKFNLSWIDRFRGYGNFLYKIKTYGFIDLACCDKLGDKHGKSPAWYTRENIKHILWAKQHRQHLIVSNCGEILVRDYGDFFQKDVRYIF